MFGLDAGGIIVLAILAVLIIHIFTGARSHSIECPNCKFTGKAKMKAGGSFAVEIILWILLIVPGIIYSVWRMSSRKLTCPQCGWGYVVKAKN